MQNVREAKKLTSGVMASNGIHSLRDPRFLEAYNEKKGRPVKILRRI
jgi:hypothetical protein